jgi:hypothetical protein
MASFDSPHRDAADRVPGKIELGHRPRVLPAQVLVGAALEDPEEKPRTGVGALGAFGPGEGQPAGLLDLAALGRKRRTDVEHHRDVHAEARLQLHCALGRQEVLRPVLGRAELDALLQDPAARGEAHHLESARVRQDRARPAHEPVEPAGPQDQLEPGPRHEVVGVGKNDAAVPGVGLEPVERDALQRPARPDGHEAGRLDHRVVGGEAAPPRRRARVPRENLEHGRGTRTPG